MITLILAEKTVDEITQQLALLTEWTGVIEWRVDYLEQIDIDLISEVLSRWSGRWLLTVRTVDQGGQYAGNSEDYYDLLKQLIVLKPAYLDVEYSIEDNKLVDLNISVPQVKLLRSYHDLDGMPDDLAGLYEQLTHPSCDLIKIILTTKSSLEILRSMIFLKNQKDSGLILHGLGRDSEASRVLAACYGSAMSFMSMNAALEVPSRSCMQEIYHIDQLDRSTQCFVLIGQPVSHSVGHIYHNAQFRGAGYNAVYVKLTVAPEEVGEFLALAQQLDFKGLSVTMPLKECVCQFVDECSEDIQAMRAANTLKFENDRTTAINTDCLACVEILTEQFGGLKGKHVLMMGAGGAARAIAWRLHQAGATLSVINRSLPRALELAHLVDSDFVGELMFDGKSLKPVDIIINTLPAIALNKKILMNLEKNIRTSVQCVALELNYSEQVTLFSQWVKDLGIQLIDGLSFFTYQAKKQQEYWDN